MHNHIIRKKQNTMQKYKKVIKNHGQLHKPPIKITIKQTVLDYFIILVSIFLYSFSED